MNAPPGSLITAVETFIAYSLIERRNDDRIILKRPNGDFYRGSIAFVVSMIPRRDGSVLFVVDPTFVGWIPTDRWYDLDIIVEIETE